MDTTTFLTLSQDEHVEFDWAYEIATFWQGELREGSVYGRPIAAIPFEMLLKAAEVVQTRRLWERIEERLLTEVRALQRQTAPKEANDEVPF